MKRKLIVFLFSLTTIALLLSLSSCAGYTAKYRLEECSLSLYECNNGDNVVEYNKKYTDGNVEIYFDSKLDSAETMDTWIESIVSISSVFTEKQIGKVPAVYISDSVVCNYSDTGAFFRSDTATEEALGWLLMAQSKNTQLPYGVYAGLAAILLNLKEYSGFAVSSVESAGYLTELQFPLYETGNLPIQERTYSWKFSYDLVSCLMRSGKSEQDIMNMGKEELNSFLYQNYRIELPSYTFFPYSSKYEYKVTQGYFTYFINKEFNDLILSKEYFDTTYHFLSDWLKDNELTTKLSNEVFRINDMYDINVYLDDGVKSRGISGEAARDYINIYSVGAFSHEYIHHALKKRDKQGHLSEIIPEMHATTSKYSRTMWYYLVTGQSKTFPYESSIKEKESYIAAMDLYKKYAGYDVTAENFNFWLFADCISALYTEHDEDFLFRAQGDSLYYYIARVYGPEYVWKLNDHKVPIGDKTIEEVIYEWVEYVKQLKI